MRAGAKRRSAGPRTGGRPARRSRTLESVEKVLTDEDSWTPWALDPRVQRYSPHVVTSAEPSGSTSFDAPPVSEAVLGIEFDPIDELGAVRLAQLASAWSPAEYSELREVPGVPPTPRGPDGEVLEFALHMGPVPTRIWLIGSDGADLLQVQNDRLIVNWRKMSADSAYPRYSALSARLKRHWDEFCNFLSRNAMDIPQQVTVESSYVNVIPHSGDLAALLTIFSAPTTELPGEDEGIQFNLTRKLPVASGDGRLTIAGGPNRGPFSETRDSYNLTVTTKIRGTVQPGAFPGALVDAAHEASVQAFASITSEENHLRWGRSS